MNELSEKALQARRQYMREYQRNMTPETRERSNAYMKEWRRKNPDKVRQNTIDFWERKAQLVTLNNTLKSTVTGIVTCLNCGKAFQPQRKTAKFCSDLCRVRYSRKKGGKP